MASAAELGDAFYSGSLFGRTPNQQAAFYGQASAYLNKKNPSRTNSRGSSARDEDYGGIPTSTVFNQDAYERARKAGYTDRDINSFLQDSGVRAEGSIFQVGGIGTYGGKKNTYWQVTPAYEPPKASSSSSESSVQAPDTSNEVLQTIKLPNNGVGTIESIKPLPESVSSPTPILGDPLGESSQRVSRQKARLSIAK